MSMTTILYRFLLRGGTASALAALNETPLGRELIVAIDARNFKLGNGATAFNSLPWLLSPHTTASGTNTLTATYTDKPVLFDGMMVRLRAAGANTGAVTFNPNGLGAVDVKKKGGTALSAGDISAAGHELLLVYRSSVPCWELINPAAGAGGATTAADVSVVDAGNYFQGTSAGKDVEEILQEIGAALGGVYPVYATTWNPSDKHASITLSGGDLTATKSAAGSADRMVRATKPRYGGKWYFEVVVNSVDANRFISIGMASGNAPLTQYVGQFRYTAIGYYGNAGEIYRDNTSYAPGPFATYAGGDVIGCAYDADNEMVWFSKNNTFLGSGVPASLVLPHMGVTGKGLYPAVAIYEGSSVTSVTGRFARASFTGTIPTGYAPWDND